MGGAEVSEKELKQVLAGITIVTTMLKLVIQHRGQVQKGKGYIIQLPVPSNKIGGDGEKDYEEVLEERRKRINKPRQVIKDEYVEDDFFSIDDDDDLDFPEDWK